MYEGSQISCERSERSWNKVNLGVLHFSPSPPSPPPPPPLHLRHHWPIPLGLWLTIEFYRDQWVPGILMALEISQASPAAPLCSAIQGKVSNPWNPIKQYHAGRTLPIFPPRSFTSWVMFAKKGEFWRDDAAIVSKTTARSGSRPINSSTCCTVSSASKPLTNRTLPKEMHTSYYY